MERKRDISHFRDLEVYQMAFNWAMRIFQLTKTFPRKRNMPLLIKYEEPLVLSVQI